MTPLEKLTIVIPTYNRQLYALRNIKYWSGKGVKVIVVDGSNEAIHDEMLEGIGDNITYVNTPVSFSSRIELALDKIDTEYAMLCGDDEFMLPTGLSDCINFLEANKDYAQCGGRAIGFDVHKNYIRLYPVKPCQASHLVNQESAFDRIHYHIENYTPSTIYAVHRAESLKLALNGSFLHEFKNGGYTEELMFELMASAIGKSKVLSSAMWLRSTENERVNDSNWDQSIYLSDWFYNPENVQEVQAMFSSLIHDVANVVGPSVNRDELVISIVQAINHRINLIDLPAVNRIRGRKSILITLKTRFKNMIKGVLLNNVFACCRFFDLDNYQKDGRFFFSSLSSKSGIQIRDQQELVGVLKTVFSFHNKAAT